MATYRIQTPDGKVFRITGDRAPTEQELNDMFGSQSSTGSTMSEGSTDWIDTANSTLRTIGGAVEAFDKGRYFGLGKRAGGLANAVLSWPVDRVADLMGVENTPTFGDRYNEIVQGAKEMNKEFAENHPVANFGLELAGGIKPANAITRGLAQKGVKSALGQSALGGGIGGALYAADESEKLSDLPVNMLVGGVGGTVGGAALHSAISGIGTASGLLRSNVKKGMDYIRKTKGDEYLQNMIDEATQKGVSLAEVADERGLDMVQMARQQTPDAKYIIHDNIRAIKDARTAKANQYIDDTFGKGSGLATVEDVKSKAIEQAQPYYEGLNGRDFAPNYKPESKVNISGKLSKEQADELLKSEMQKVAGENAPINNTPKLQTTGIGEYVNKNPFIKNEISNVRKDLTWSEGVRNAPDTSFDILNAVKKNIDDKINVAKRAGNNEEMARLVNIKNELVGKMDAVAPEYAEARKIYENAYRFEDAADLGRDILGKGLEQRPERFSAKFAKLSDNEKEAVRAGFWDDLRAKINTVNNPDIGWKSTLNPYAQRKIKMILGEQEGNRLIDFAKMRVKSTDNLNAMHGGSTTANNQTLRDKGIKAVQDLVTGKIESFLPSNNARNMGIARIMTNPSADLARATYEQVASPQGWEAVYQALYNPRGFTKYNTALAAYLAGRELQQ